MTYKEVANLMISNFKSNYQNIGVFEEKAMNNIKRRVYDSLNVQYAADVLKKQGKIIMPNYENINFQ